MSRIDENTTTLGFPYLKYIPKTNQVTDNDALDWLYPNGNISYQETILCSNNESIDRWNAIVQRMNTGAEHKLMSRDSFEEVDDPYGHLKKMLPKQSVTNFGKMEFPITSLYWKGVIFVWSHVQLTALVRPIIHKCELLMCACILSR